MFNDLGKIRHAKIELPKPAVHATHPYRHEKNHTSLLEYLQQRLRSGAEARDMELGRWVQIDKNVAGWMKLDKEDKKRQNKQAESGIPLATEVSLPLAYVHLDDMMTFFAQTFSPNRGMFYQTGKPEEQKDAKQIVTIMNNHSIYAGYFRQTLLGIYSLLKYNRGGFHVHWAKDEGPKIIKDANDKSAIVSETRWQGNKMIAIDVYNFLYDASVHPTKLHEDGEFAATADTLSYFKLQSIASRGGYFNCEKALDCENAEEQHERVYYRNPPKEANFGADSSSNGDWKAVLAGVDGYGLGAGFERVEIYIKLNPTEFGLIDGTAAERKARSRYETWRFTILNDKYIIDATHMNNMHGHLPYYQGTLNDDIMGTAQKSTAEILHPLQNFASSLINTHVKANRKNLWGLTGYDPTMFDFSGIPEGEVAARIPMLPAAFGRDIRTGITEFGGTLDTKQTLQDLQGVMDIINNFFPTQSLPNQIASIDRAVDSQVAAVQQGANRRQQKSARLLDDSVFRNVRAAMYYNIIQYQPADEEVTDYYTGNKVPVNLDSLRNTDLPFIIGQGLKAIDRQAAAANLQKIIFAMIQAPQAAQGVDILGIINYWTDMIDIDIDMTQFKLAPPPTAGGAPAIDPATGAPIVPATNPASVSAPIYG